MTRACGRLSSALLAAACLVIVPTTAQAQSAIAGTVEDASGAVLPGVTVEASSPVLIEKVRTATTNERGQFTIVDLRPGVYRVTFTLAGFNTFIRDGSSCPPTSPPRSTSTCASACSRRSVTVTGESPVVDVASTARVQVLDREALDALPTGRSIYSMAQLVPGVAAQPA